MNSKPLNTKKYKKSAKVVTEDTLYWKKLGVPTLVKEFGAIDYIDFSPVEPYYFAVTCSVRVQIYNPSTKLVAKNLSRFQESAYGGSFRQDGRLLVAGDEEGFVKLFDTSSKNVLRLFRGHKAAVHRTFFTPDLLHIASFSDDKTVKLWDIATEQAVQTFEKHIDYIRAGCVNPVSSNIILSGSYDNTINMYDTRTEEILFNVNHGSPVESLLFLPTGGIFISAGGTEIKVWDAIAGGKLLASISQHHKTITSLKLASNGKRIVSGGLDRHMKIYDVATYQTVHNLDFPNSVLCVGVSPNDETVVAGMVNGLISIQNMEKDDKPIRRTDKKRTIFVMPTVDHIVSAPGKRFEKKYDFYLRKFEYTKALDEALKVRYSDTAVTVMQELIRRKGLHRALAGRSYNSLAVIIRFIIQNIGEHRFMRVLIDVANILLDVYADNFYQYTGEFATLFWNLADELIREVNLSYDMLELQGALELIIGAAKVSEDVDECYQFCKETSKLKQSEKAKENPAVVLK